jgi:predicted transposase YbfD/YdcC
MTAIPEVLRLLDLRGCTVTIDAMGCPTASAKQGGQQRGEYVLAVKHNHEQLYGDIVDTFRYAHADHGRGVAHRHHHTLEGAHGRIEQRDDWLIRDPDVLAYRNPQGRWLGLSAIGMVHTERVVKDKPEHERR